ncbi:stage II sporulation protein M [Paenibacillus sp. N1-5-1-14]|uniref:stage II sporulation protein M n=1 Tax=Paenibacillus radicibacter TaxID=2972488 RepID=UPI0021598FAF|nr:stage II sporulation protein M [Paenibacillus radicibacter]MCR8645459.1 stage II sporulation protein M [Paenibacillus radicibacter]
MYRDEWLYFKRDYRKAFVWVLIVSMIVFFIMLWGAEQLFRSNPENVMQFLQDRLGVDSPQMVDSGFTHIFLHNLRAAVSSFLLGLIPIVILPAFTTVATIASISFVIPFAQSLGVSAWKIIVYGILPHGLLEIPAFALASAIGIYMSLSIIRQLFNKRKLNRPLLQVMKQCLRSFILVVFPLILIAAVIEAFVTSAILHNFT